MNCAYSELSSGVNVENPGKVQEIQEIRKKTVVCKNVLLVQFVSWTPGKDICVLKYKFGKNQEKSASMLIKFM